MTSLDKIIYDNWESVTIGAYTLYNKSYEDDDYVIIKTEPLVVLYKNKNFKKVQKRLKELVSDKNNNP